MGRNSSVFLLFLCATGLDIILGAKVLFALSRRPHYDIEFKVTVTAQGVSQGQQVQVGLELCPEKDCSKKDIKELTFYSDGVQTVKFIYTTKNKTDSNSPKAKLLVYNRHHEKQFILDFTTPSGYIFVQTDKPVYKPGQIVKYRIVAVDEQQRIPDYSVKVDIKDDKKVVLDQLHFPATEAFKAQEFLLPRETPSGFWSIEAKFETDKLIDRVHVTQFEVKEYVLPRFRTSVKLDKEVITRNDAWITLNVEAKMIYNKPVLGSVSVQFGLWNESKGLSLLEYKLQGKLDETGKYVKYIRVSDLVSKKKGEFPVKSRLYMNVNVTEDETGELDTIIDTSTVISNPYYEIILMSNPLYKPGLPYKLQLHAKTKSGKSAGDTKVRVAAFYWVNKTSIVRSGRARDRQERKVLAKAQKKKTDMDGNVDFSYIIPKNSVKKIAFKIRVYTMGRRTSKRIIVKSFASKNEQYLQILMKEPIKERRDGEIELRYSKLNNEMPAHNIVNKITVLVMSRGQIVHTDSVYMNPDSRSFVSLPSKLYTSVTPRMRVVAFYQYEDESIMDTIDVDTDHVCQEELSLENNDVYKEDTYEPREDYALRVNGGRNMRVGLVAVDKAVLLINSAESISREKMFEELGSHDLVKLNKAENNATKIFRHSGLHYAIIDTDAPFTRPETGGVRKVIDQPTEHERRTFKPVETNSQDYYRQIKNLGYKVRPQTIRNDFPESWLFEEHTIDSSGRLVLRRTLPDSITTWSFLAVGISANRGICVSRRYEEIVEKQFFAEIRIPYKVRRLEVVKVKVIIYNYASERDTHATVSLTGGEGLCIPKNNVNKYDAGDSRLFYNITVSSKKPTMIEFKVIPLRIGELDIEAIVNGPTPHRDAIKRKFLVVPEGRKVRKTLTVALDPEAKQAPSGRHRYRHNKVILSDTKLIQNFVDVAKKEQTTKIELGLPKEVIFGSESCSVNVFGDLMGDIISHAVKQSKTLVENPGINNAEKALHDLAPTVHALLYARKFGLLNTDMKKQATTFVKNAVNRLINYQHRTAFRLNKKSKPSTWLTVFALKSLCFAQKVTHIDYTDSLIKPGFDWLKNRQFSRGSYRESGHHLYKDTLQSRLKLSAEVLIALHDCSIADDPAYESMRIKTRNYLKNHWRQTGNMPLVLAKVAYALYLNTNSSDVLMRSRILKKLLSLRKGNRKGQIYWSNDNDEVDNDDDSPFMYHKGPKATSIEATSYALMLCLEQINKINIHVDRIADWLNAQRNSNGAFVGAMDSDAAIQALSRFSSTRQSADVDLRCNLTLSDEHKHFFQFTSENAINLEKIDHVPVNKQVEVLTKGRGLGQMHLNLEYNVPIIENEHCQFNVTVETKETVISLANANKPILCAQCNYGCPASQTNTRRWKRDLRNHPHASRKTMCMKICLKPLGHRDSGPVEVQVEMLTGFEPVTVDLDKMEENPNILAKEFNSDEGKLTVHLNRVKAYEQTCVFFRAIDDKEVARFSPASVTVRGVDEAEPSCSEEYQSPLTDQSLQTYCATNTDETNRGECRCFTGLCGDCLQKSLTDDLGELVCRADIAYQLQIPSGSVESKNQWTEINATILSVEKTNENNAPNQNHTAHLVTPNSCTCFVRRYQSDPFYMLSSNVVKLLDRHGDTKYVYLLDQRSKFLSTTDYDPRSGFPKYSLQLQFANSDCD